MMFGPGPRDGRGRTGEKLRRAGLAGPIAYAPAGAGGNGARKQCGHAPGGGVDAAPSWPNGYPARA